MRSFYSVQNSIYDCNQFVWLEWFRKIRIDSGAETLDTIRCFVFRGEKDYWDQGRSGRASQLSRKLISVHPRHSDVTNYQIRDGLSQMHQCFAATASRTHVII